MRIGVVVVTYNRLEKLKKCLAAYDAQILEPAFVLVIDNASSDGTADFLKGWKSAAYRHAFGREVLTCEKNLGGAGGFAAGVEKVLADAPFCDCDWLFIADDDAYPEPDCLLKLAAYAEMTDPHHSSNMSALCASVVDAKGKVSKLHRRVLMKKLFQVKELPLSEETLKKASLSGQPVEIDLFSFVGAMLRVEAVRQAGIPRADFFIYFDDSEYSLRLKEKGKLLCIPDAVIVHDSPEKALPKSSWKHYYMFRNKLYLYRRYFPRRYFYVEALKTGAMVLRYFNCPQSRRQFKEALQDAKTGALGVRSEYLP